MGCRNSKNSILSTGGFFSSECKKKYPRTENKTTGNRFETVEQSRSLSLGSIKIRYAYISQRGFYPDDSLKPNQDTCSITENFCVKDNDVFFAVYDGHGRFGEKCAQYARDNLPILVSKYIHRENSSENVKKKLKCPKDNCALVDLIKDQTQRACLKAHIQCNRTMHRSLDLDDSLSGTTAISCYIDGREKRITICNVGDSRAILGQEINRVMVTFQNNDDHDASSPSYHALPLSQDQTPYRSDERRRILNKGARILSLDQIEGLEPINDKELKGGEYCELQHGNEIDEAGDPPRVWSSKGDYPGTAFTRSLGDSIAEELGVFAEPEMVTKILGQKDKIIVLASDGVFEFLTNQSVIDICAKFDDPLEACRAVVAESYELWLQYELRTDDITMICIFLDDITNISTSYQYSTLTSCSFPRKISHRGSDDNIDTLNPVEHSSLCHKYLLKLKMKENEECNVLMNEEMRDQILKKISIEELFTKKTLNETEQISKAIRGSVMLRNISKQQRDMIYGVFESIKVRKGNWIIKQGTFGDRFYIINEGKFEVRIFPKDRDVNQSNGGDLVHIYEGSRKLNEHPTFGELALMYSAPRLVSIIAQTDGKLWALHRYAFKKVITY